MGTENIVRLVLLIKFPAGFQGWTFLSSYDSAYVLSLDAVSCNPAVPALRKANQPSVAVLTISMLSLDIRGSFSLLMCVGAPA